MACLPPKIAVITLFNCHTPLLSLTFLLVEHYTFSVLRKKLKFVEPRGLSPSPSTQTTEKEHLGRQATLISYSIKSSFKAKVTDFVRTLKPAAFQSFGKTLQVPAVIICQGTFVSKTFFCLPDKHKDYTVYFLHRVEARETLRSQLLQQWKLQLPWSL